MKRTYVLAALLVLTSCLSVSAADDPVVAQAGNWKMTKSDFQKLMTYYPEAKQYFEQNPENQGVFLKRIVQIHVIADVARKAGLDKRADIREQLDLNINNFLATQYLKSEIADKVNVTDEDMRLYYKTHMEEFTDPEQVKASHILVRVDSSASEDAKKATKTKAEEILKKATAGEDFGKLASEFSDDPGSKIKGGDLGFFAKGRMVKPFEDAAFSLKPGEVSNIVETQFGYHIIKVTERKEAATEPYEEVRDKVKAKVTEDLRRAGINDFIEKAMKNAGAEIHPELLQEEK